MNLVIWVALGCSVVSAFFMAFGAQRQGSAVRSILGGSVVRRSNFFRLVGNPRWLLGIVFMAVGLLLNVAALTFGPLTVVQPVGAIALVITTMVNVKDRGIQLNWTTIAAIAACLAGSIGFVLMAVHAVQENHDISAGEQLTVVILLLIVVCFFSTVAWLRRRAKHSFFYVLGAGFLFGFVAVLTRILCQGLFHAPEAFFADIPWLTLLGIVVAGILGSWFVQNAYASGPPELVVAGLTVIDPLVGVGVGIGILGELSPGITPLTVTVMALASLLAIGGVLLLARYHPDVLQRQASACRTTASKHKGRMGAMS